MTDKQIIIDGVDVSECTRYCADNGKCTAFKSQYLCSERNNCYTKRILKKNKTINILKEKLLRKEQECEKLRFPMKDSNYAILTKEEFEKYDQLKAENKDLKDEIRLIHDDCKGCSTCFNALESARIYCVENQNLKQTLTEIKEIVYLLNDRTMVRKDICDRLDLILQKISEVEDD